MTADGRWRQYEAYDCVSALLQLLNCCRSFLNTIRKSSSRGCLFVALCQSVPQSLCLAVGSCLAV